METKYFFRHLPISEALKTFTDGKLDSVANLVNEEFPVAVTISNEHQEWGVKIACHSHDKHHIEVSADSDEVHKSVDLAVDKLAKVLRRRKDKLVHKRQSQLGHELDAEEAAKRLEAGVMSEAIDGGDLKKQADT